MKNDEIATSSCCHSLRIGSLCAVCGVEINNKDDLVPALHNTDRLVLTQDEAQTLHKAKNEKLEKSKKMILILDLDQTLLHTTFQESYCDFTFSIFSSKFYVKLRPFLRKFLKKMHKIYEIHVYTMGTREYATKICKYLDPKGKFFGDRIVTRCENFNEMTKSINRITSVYSNVVILDDRADVWNYSPNLILIKPFYFKDTIDINDPSKIPAYIPNTQKINDIVVSIPEKVIETQSSNSNDIKNLEFSLDLNSEKIEENPTKISESQSSQNDSFNSNILNINNNNLLVIPENSSQISSEIVQEIPEKSQIDSKPFISIQNALSDQKNQVFSSNTNDHSDIENKIPTDPVSQMRLKDRELLKAIKILTKLHHRYFKTKKDVQELLKIKSFKKLKIASGFGIHRMIVFSGASLDFDNPSLVIDNRELAEKYNVLNVSVDWLYNSIYERKALPTSSFIISDHRVKFDIYQEDEFSNLIN